jgi:hypothetical protein
MAIHIPPPAAKEAESRESRRRSAAPPPPFVPPAARQPADQAPASAAAVHVSRQKQRMAQQQSQQQSAAARERHAEKEHAENTRAGNALAGDLNLEAAPNERRSVPEEAAKDAIPSDASAQDALALQESQSGDQPSAPAEMENIREKAAPGKTDGESLDMDELAAQLLPPTADDGIFEVTLPNGHTIGVAVNFQPGNVRYHLSVSDEKSAERIRHRKMELQGHVERRIRQNVEIILL